MSQTTPSLPKGIQAFFQTPNVPPVPGSNAATSFDTPSPTANTVAMQLKAAAPVITQKKTTAGLVKSKSDKAASKNKKATPGNKMKLLPKIMDVVKDSAGGSKMFPLSVDLTTGSAASEVEVVTPTTVAPTDVKSSAEDPVSASIEIIEDTDKPNAVADIITETVHAVVSTAVEVISSAGTSPESETVKSTKENVPIVAKKPRAPRKKKMSAKAIAAAEAEKGQQQNTMEVVVAASASEVGPPALIEITPPVVVAKAPIAVTSKKPAAKPTPVVKPVVVLSPLVEDKINTYRLKVNALAEELHSLQNRGAEFDSDQNLNMENLVDGTVSLVVNSWQKLNGAAVEKAVATDGGMDIVAADESVNTSAVSPPSTACTSSFGEAIDPLLISLNKILCCVVQGSSSPLFELVVKVESKLSELMMRSVSMINQDIFGDDDSRKISLPDLAGQLLTHYPDNCLLKAIFNFDSHCALSELRVVINGVALREAHGYRAKDAIAFEDVNALSIWAWEVTKKESTFSKDELAIVKECCGHRRRYGRSIKAYMESLEQIQKSASLDTPKVLQAEEKASKAFAEVEKAKEKRIEVERKRQAEIGEKVQRDQAKEEKLREKEELIRKKKETAALEAAAASDKKREAEARKLEEKAAMEAEKKLVEDKKEKQRKLMQSFFVSKPAVVAASTSSEADVDTLVTSVDVATSGVVDLNCVSAVKQKKRSYDEAVFAIIGRGEEISRSEVLRSFRQRHIAMKESSKSMPTKKRQKIKIQVPVEVSNGDIFGAESYTELTDKYVDGKMKLFQFHDYEKTKYWGTFSKKSSIVRGRSFYKKDEELRNYDVDSAEEWEDEEEVGEDIIDSDEDKDPDEPNEPNELVYDDFFRHDDDFGSDNEEDGVRTNVPRFAVVGKSVAGPRFIQTSPVYHDTALNTCESISPANKALDSEPHVVVASSFDVEGNIIHCMDSDKDVTRLMNFFTVVYPDAISDAPVIPSNVPGGEACTASSSGAGGDQIDASAQEKGKALTMEQSQVLATFVHGKKWGLDKLVDGLKLKTEFSDTSKALILRTIKDMAVKEKGGEGVGSMRWVVKPVQRVELELELPEIEYTPAKIKKRIAPTSVTGTTPVSALFPAQTAADLTIPVAVGVSVEAAVVLDNDLVQPAVVVAKTATKIEPSKPISKPLTAFFKKPTSVIAKADTETSASVGSPDSDVLIFSPEATPNKPNENGNTPRDFDVFDRLVGTPSATPFAKGVSDSSEAMEIVSDSTGLFGNSEELMVLDLSTSSPS